MCEKFSRETLFYSTLDCTIINDKSRNMIEWMKKKYRKLPIKNDNKVDQAYYLNKIIKVCFQFN